MTLLDISGIATLILPDGTEIRGPATLTVMERGGFKEGRGTFRSEANDLYRAFGATEALALKFHDGASAKVIVMKADMHGLQFVTTGPVT